ncbi:hypothetical protein SAMN05216573_12237 [Bradyrhizobium sp. Rc3b]|uniref:hypothetical protein n=1 Tax=Bradyrhizobium sp. Rc3b TaxID=1855322 RepID=UPI0008EC48F7|nr:hypothetical protein [Bradyrhizobium sp. Rc3b]SFN80470.1 hypothetical protein SAMN05216573_12237 [Bradyrhizobium sp. Rc3b]
MPRDRDLWTFWRGGTLEFLAVGAADKSFIEALKSRFQAEGVNAHWFLGLGAPSTKLERWAGIAAKSARWEVGGRPAILLHNCLGETSSPT